MFEARRPTTKFSSAVNIIELIYHSIVRSIRSQHGNAFMSIGVNLLQMCIMVAALYVLFSLLGLRSAALRGDFLIYILTGIFLFMTHVKSMSAVVGAAGPSDAMMKHAPMNTMIAIISKALSALYIQILAGGLILFGYHVGVTPFEIENAAGCMAMLLLAWFTGCALGLVLLAIKPWAPTFVSVVQTVYQRANMIASGKMFVANMLPSDKIALFDWNPLFHIIDQSRGFAFVNYFPRNSNWEYPFYMGIAFLMVGLMGEFYTRKQVSASWFARR